MKHLSLFVISMFISVLSSAQCEAPELLDWTAVNDTTFNITFDSPVEAEYKLEMRLDYAEEVGIYEILTTTGTTTAGTNTLTVAISDEDYPWNNPGVIYFTAYLSLECEQGVFSDSTKFYVSAHSMVGESGFNCDSLYQLFEPLPDFGGVPYVSTFTVPDNGEVIESLSVFVDIGHTFNGDLLIKLTHPNGTEIILQDFNNPALGASWGFSVIFTDESDQIIENTADGIGPRGIFQPSEPLSVLIGEPLAGEWTLTIIDNWAADDGMLFGTCLTLNGIPCIASVEGTAFYDFNGNGVQNSPEPSFPYANILNSISGDQFYGDENGDFWNCTEGGSGTLEVLNTPEYFGSAPVDITVMADDQLEGILLPITSTVSVSDITVDLFSLEPNRPGFEADYRAQVANVGTICQDGVDLSLSFPEYVTIVSAENPDMIITENTASLDVGQVCPFGPLDFDFTILLDDTVSIGTVLEATATVTPNEGDENVLNNEFTSSVIVVGSYDPNDKQVSTATINDAFMAAESPLKYTVRFQNTGTFYAERVVIADTIDIDLDINSLHILSTSHSMELSREGNVVYFEFDQIFLPDSTTDFEGSIGHVRYEITPHPGFGMGDMIENTAYIYFDFNAPIITNTVVTTFQNPLSISEYRFDTQLYPNPTEDRITLEWSEEVSINRIEIFDVSGRMVKDQVVRNDHRQVLDVSDLPDGVYAVKIYAGDAFSSVMFVKR
jgi:subtilisin-like proprotein convertase family protein